MSALTSEENTTLATGSDKNEQQTTEERIVGMIRSSTDEKGNQGFRIKNINRSISRECFKIYSEP